MMKYTFEIDLDRYKNLAQQKQKTHKKFLAGLAKKPPKQLDKIVKEVHEEVFLEIDCTKCANCCKTLGPLWTEADIERVAKHLKMKVSDFEVSELTKMVTKFFKPCLVSFLVLTISVAFTKFGLKLVANFPILTVKRFIKSII